MKIRSLTMLPLALGALATATACDSDEGTTQADTTQSDTASDTASDTTQSDTAESDTAEVSADSGPSDASPNCDYTGFSPVAQDFGPFLGAFLYVAQSTLETPVDTLAFELVEANGGAKAAGTYEITDAPYESCGNCVILRVGCDENLSNCQKSFLAESGTLEIAEFGESGGKFSGTLKNAILRQVSIAPDSVSVPVEKGETWCLDAYAFEASVQ
jgi:hypothetical protein